MELFIKSKTIYKTLLLGSLAMMGLDRSLVAAEETAVSGERIPSENVHRSKRLGDQAFYDGDYPEAIKFYTKYKKDTARVADELELAYEALITSYINIYDVDNASLELGKYVVEVGVGVEVLDYFNAEIKRIGKKYTEAIPQYLQVLKVVRPTNRIYFSTLNGLGLSYEETNDWDQAIIAYRAIEQECPKSSWRHRAAKQKIFAMIMANKFDEVESLLNNPPKMKGDSDRIDLDLFRIFMLAKKKKFLELDLLYKKVQGEIQVESYPLCYKIDMLIAESLIQNNEHTAAASYLRDAYTFATNAFERQKSLKALMNVYVAVDDKQSAVNTAERFLGYYSNSTDATNIRLQMARLLFAMNNGAAALKNYELIINDPKSTLSQTVVAAKEVAFISMDQNNYDLAIEKLNYVLENVSDLYKKGEAKYYLAKILYLQKKDLAAYEEFVKIANTYKEWRQQSLYQAMYALDRSEKYNNLLKISSYLINEFSDSKAGVDARFYHAIALANTGSNKEALEELLLFVKDFPNHKLSPQVLFRLAGLSFDAGNYSDCTRFYSDLISTYSDAEIVPNALYKRMFSLFFLGKFDEAVIDLDTLVTDHPSSKYTFHALNWLSDHYASNKEYEKADLTLQRIPTFYNDDKAVLSTVLLDRASILLKAQKNVEAAVLADTIIVDYSDQSVYLKAIYLRADIFSYTGEYLKAIELYQKVYDLATDTFVKTGASGRIGDCNFSLYSKEFNNEFLETATKMYTYVLAQSNISTDFRIQSLYKIGKCYELLSFEKKAISSYKELLFDFKSNPSETKLWFVKGANALASLYIKKNTPELGKSAIIIYRDLIKRGVKPIGDYRSEILKIKKKYKL